VVRHLLGRQQGAEQLFGLPRTHPQGQTDNGEMAQAIRLYHLLPLDHRAQEVTLGPRRCQLAAHLGQLGVALGEPVVGDLGVVVHGLPATPRRRGPLGHRAIAS